MKKNETHFLTIFTLYSSEAIALESSSPPFIQPLSHKKTSQSMLVSVLFKEDCQLQSIYKSS